MATYVKPAMVKKKKICGMDPLLAMRKKAEEGFKKANPDQLRKIQELIRSNESKAPQEKLANLLEYMAKQKLIKE